jgi:hypothetical protein
VSLAFAFPAHLEQTLIPKRPLPSIENRVAHEEQEKTPAQQRPPGKNWITYEQPTPAPRHFEHLDILMGAYAEPEKFGVPALRSCAPSLESTFVIENRRSVLRFVEGHGLSGLLLEAEQHLKAVFGVPTIKVLTLLNDEEGMQTLFCYVKFPGSLAAGRNALKAFDRQWWRARYALGNGRLNFDFDLI